MITLLFLLQPPLKTNIFFFEGDIYIKSLPPFFFHSFFIKEITKEIVHKGFFFVYSVYDAFFYAKLDAGASFRKLKAGAALQRIKVEEDEFHISLS